MYEKWKKKISPKVREKWESVSNKRFPGIWDQN